MGDVGEEVGEERVLEMEEAEKVVGGDSVAFIL